MKNIFKTFSFVVLTFFLVQNCIAETFHFFRPYAFDYSGTKASININGRKKVVGSEDYVNFSLNGAFTITVDGHGILGLQMKKSRLRGNAKSSGDRYFLITAREDLISKFVITEASKKNFEFARGQTN